MKRWLFNIPALFGLGLPQRKINLQFNLPPSVAEFKPNDLTGNKAKSDFAAVEKMPLEYFKLLQAQIRFLTRSVLSKNKHFKMLQSAEKLFYQKATEQALEHAKRGGVPDSEIRQQVLDTIVDIAQALAVSYQILFRKYYTGGNYAYLREKDVVQCCAFRILELIAFKQFVLGLRYQQLTERDWQTANTVFQVMHCYDDVDVLIETLQSAQNSADKKQQSSLRSMFTLIQIVGLVDMMCWPTHLHAFLGSYLASIDDPVQIRSDDGVAKLNRNSLLAYCYGSSAPLRERLPGAGSQALLLDCKGFMEALRQDCLNLITSKRENKPELMPARFSRLPEVEKFVVADLLTKALFDAKNETVREHEHKAADLRVYVGFNAVRSLIVNAFKEGASERLADQLAKRSALIAEDHVATVESAWYIVFQNNKMIRLRTQETKFTTSMSIGVLLAYGLGEETVNRPRLAVVTRIHRISAKTVVIDLQRLARYAEPVLVTADGNAQDKGRQALLLFDALLGGWCLALPPQDYYLSVKNLSTKRKDQDIEFSLGNLRNVTTDFYLFATTLTSSQIGANEHPEYPSVVRKVITAKDQINR